jgi:hypothetical protein
MRLRASLLHLQKDGNVPVEYEDAAEFDPVAGRFAIADGATDAYDSGRWARMLAGSFLSDGFPRSGPEELGAFLEDLSHEWADEIDFAQLPWYKEEKARLGAFSTFLGLQFDQNPRSGNGHSAKGTWRALALGDACLFHIRDDQLLSPTPFPIASSKEFGVTPPLISTDARYTRKSLTHLKTASGYYEAGDTFVLATDAIAQWLMCTYEEGGQPWNEIGLMEEPAFQEFVSNLRRARAMRNDDVTLLVIRVEGSRVYEREVTDQPQVILPKPPEELIIRQPEERPAQAYPEGPLTKGPVKVGNTSVREDALLTVLLALNITMLLFSYPTVRKRVYGSLARFGHLLFGHSNP